VLEALAEFWQPQRRSIGRGQSSGEGMTLLTHIPLEVRLTEILGPPARNRTGTPQGSFPAPLGWPA
jgi:hypothetical protein